MYNDRDSVPVLEEGEENPQCFTLDGRTKGK